MFLATYRAITTSHQPLCIVVDDFCARVHLFLAPCTFQAFLVPSTCAGSRGIFHHGDALVAARANLAPAKLRQHPCALHPDLRRSVTARLDNHLGARFAMGFLLDIIKGAVRRKMFMA